MIDCCGLSRVTEFCFRVPNNYLELLSMLPDCNSYANARANSVDRSSNLLHAVPVKHDPYTPDSMDSPSPNALIASVEVPDLDADHLDSSNIAGGDSVSPVPRSIQTSITSRRHVDRAVSPALLKSRLELIVQLKSKSREDAELETDTSEMKRSPSECHLRSWPGAEEPQWCARKNRCNSDLSWQRSHVLTQAWIQGKSQQGYHSFSNFGNRSSSNSSPDIVDGLPPDLIIPRIAIINASNFESNESSVYFHDDRLSNYSENKLSAYSDGRTKTLSGEGVSSDKSDEICKTDEEESNLLSSGAKRIVEVEGNKYSKGHDNPSKELCFEEDGREFVDECDMCKETKCQIVEVQALVRNKSCARNDAVLNRTSDKLILNIPNSSVLPVLVDESCLKDGSLRSTETQLEKQPRRSQTSQRINANKPGANSSGTNVETAPGPRDQDCDSNVINVYSDVHVDHAVSHDAEIVSCESKQRMCTSKDTTRSNSAQDIGDHAGSVRLKMKAYRVTERYKSDIIGRRTRCRKCCCVVS